MNRALIGLVTMLAAARGFAVDNFIQVPHYFPNRLSSSPRREAAGGESPSGFSSSPLLRTSPVLFSFRRRLLLLLLLTDATSNFHIC